MECSICATKIRRDFFITTCEHSYHIPCINKWLSYKKTCPMCRRKLHYNIIKIRKPVRNEQLSAKDIKATIWFKTHNNYLQGIYEQLPFLLQFS